VAAEVKDSRRSGKFGVRKFISALALSRRGFSVADERRTESVAVGKVTINAVCERSKVFCRNDLQLYGKRRSGNRCQFRAFCGSS
jgi:hypothetical protein